MSIEFDHSGLIDINVLLAALGTDEQRLLSRLTELEFGDADVRRLGVLSARLDDFHHQFSAQGHDLPYTASTSGHAPIAPELLERLRHAHCCSSGNNERYDKEYVRNRIAIGVAQQRLGLTLEANLATYRRYLTQLMPLLWEISDHDFTELEASLSAILKVILFDIGIMSDTYSAVERRQIAREITTQTLSIFEPASISATTKSLFSLTAELSVELKVRYAMVARIPARDASEAFPLAATDNGEPLDISSYRIQGTPCAVTIEHGLTIYDNEVQTLFPDALTASKKGVRSYAGIPLFGHTGAQLGILAVFDDAPFIDTGKITRLLSIFALRAAAEIERLQVEQALMESELRFRTAFNQAAVGIVHMAGDGRFLRVNDQSCKMLGYAQGALTGRHFMEISVPGDISESHLVLAKLLGDPDQSIKFDQRLIREDGSQLWGQITASCVLDEAAELAYFVIVIEDISERKRLEGMLHISNRVLASSGSGFIITDASQPLNPIIFANPAFCRLSGYTLDEVLGRDILFLQNSDADQQQLTMLRSAIENKTEAQAVLRNYRKDGVLFWSEVSISPVLDDSGKITHFIVIQKDITEQKCYEEKLAFLATHDELTGLPNRNLLKDRLQQAILQAERNQDNVGLLFIDIDHFKLINESIGHLAGDQLLKAIAERLSGCIRDGDTISRYGGDEFVIVLRNIEKSHHVASICEAISRAISNPFSMQEKKLHVSCSIGIALYPRDGDDAETLSKYADMALYRAKDLGRSNYQFFSSEMNEKMLERVALENALHSAIAGNQLLLHYQPLVDLQTGKLVSLEALVRWQHPELGMIAPDRFIPIAEESGLIAAIGEWVLRRACQDMRSWLDEGLTDFRVAVNVSPRQFRDTQLAEKIEDVLAEMRIDPHMLSLEITETVLMQDTASSENILRQLKVFEVDLILDDFGTGYSSLSYLKRFPFDRVKIDRSFISDIETDQDDVAIAKTIISMAHSLGIKVVAEGVESEAQCNFLRRNMCDEMQGFFFSHPLPKAEIGVLLRDGCRLPEHIFGVKQSSRTLLLVDDEPNILTALKRLLRRDGYEILTANSGEEGLALLEDKAVDVIVSDQRMPGMSGVDFLRAAKEKYPDTVRIVLSGYTELKSVTDAVNEGAIYKFFTKPWEDNQLRGHIAEAFRRKEIEDENRRLNAEVQTVNQELATANRQLGMVLKQKQQKIARDEVSLDIVREVLEHLPLPIIGLDDQAMVVFVNAASAALFSRMGLMPGCDLAYVLPSLSEAICDMPEHVARIVEIDGAWFSVTCRSMGVQSRSRGRLITLTPCEDIA